MKKLRVLFIVTLALLVFGSVSVSADDDFQGTVQSWIDAGVNAPRVEYTYDSVRKTGITVEPYADALTQTVGVQLRTDLDFGICIYDNPNTEEIDGIRVNGQTITSLKVPFDEVPTEIVVDVRLDYKTGIVGDLARMSDGTYDWTHLLENPLGLLAVIYYIVATVTLITTAITAAISKSKKVKTANEIANSVRTESDEAMTKMREYMLGYLDDQISPVLKNFVGSTQQIVKAIALSTSKSKEAPIALLDTLKDVSNVDVDHIIETAKQSVLEADKKLTEKRLGTQALLETLVSQTDREVETNDTETEPKQKDDTQQTTSVF